jgi:hypothetical protein
MHHAERGSGKHVKFCQQIRILQPPIGQQKVPRIRNVDSVWSMATSLPGPMYEVRWIIRDRTRDLGCLR